MLYNRSFTLRMPIAVCDRLQLAASELGISPSEIARTAIAEYLDWLGVSSPLPYQEAGHLTMEEVDSVTDTGQK